MDETTNRTNKYIISLVKEYPIGDLITKVYDNDDDMVVSLSADLARVCNNVYPKLYTSPTPDEQQRKCYVESLSLVPSKISPYASNNVGGPNHERNSPMRLMPL